MSSPLPRRKSVSLRFADLKTVAAALGLAAASLGLSGCPGDLDPRLMTTGPTVCDAATFMRGTTCSIANCHHSTNPSGGLDLFSDGVAGRLLGHMPDPANGTTQCGSVTTPYIVPNSEPVMGLLLDKLKPMAEVPCGLPMPYPGIMLLPANEIACITEWAQAVAKGQIQ